MENKNIKLMQKIMKNSANNNSNKDNMNKNIQTQSNGNMNTQADDNMNTQADEDVKAQAKDNMNAQADEDVKAQAEDNMNAQADEDVKVESSRTARNIITLIFLGLIIGIVGYSTYIRSVDFEIESSKAQAAAMAELEAKQQAEFRRLLIEKENERVSGIKAGYKESFAKIIKDAQSDINSTISSKISLARGQVSPIAEKFRSFSVLKDVLWYKSKDIAFSTNELNGYIENLIGDSLTSACVDAQASVNSNLEYLVLRLNEEANNMQSDLVEGIPEQLKTPEYESSLVMAVANIHNSVAKVKGSSESLGGNVLGIVVEGVFIYFERAVFKNIAIRVASTLGLSATAAVADGPLPILDVAAATFTTGCFAWTAWDLYNLRDEAADSIKADLDNTLDTFEADLKASANTVIEQLKAQLETRNS